MSFSTVPVFRRSSIEFQLDQLQVFNAEGRTDTESEQGAEFLRREKTDGILGVGGGSSMDLAKALSVLGTNKGSVGEYIGVNLVKESPIPLLVMPTTAGSGSEVTRVAVLTDHKKKFKGGIVSPLIPPKAAILDPLFLTTLPPPRVIAETGIDALSHAIEAFYSQVPTYSAIFSKDAIRGCIKSQLVANPQNVKAAGNMLLGDMLAGAAFLNTGVGNVHALAHALGSYHHISHALSVAVLLPHVMEHNLNACMERFTEMATAMGANIQGLPHREAAWKAVEEVRCLLADLGIPGKMSDLHVTDTHFKEMADDAVTSPPYFSNPRRCTVEELLGVLQRAL
jgi:alcohol dehydrogenase class IV